MWLRTKNNLINLDNVQSFESSTRPNKTEVVYADFAGYEDHGERELVCTCEPEDAQPLLDAIADALTKKEEVFNVPYWLGFRNAEEI